MRDRTSVLLLNALLLVLALVAASCGSSSSLLGNTTGRPGAQSAVDTDTSASSDSTGFTSLPSIPLDHGDSRGTSDVTEPPANFTVMGKDYLSMRGGTVDGDSLTLATGFTPPPGEGRPELSYGLYQASGLGDGRPLSLNVECLAGEFGDGYFIGIADYTRARWAWFGPVTLPEFQLDLSRNDHRFVTQLGNLYFILVCPPNTTITHSQTTVVMGPAGSGGQIPPGIAHGLRASDGGFDHQIMVDWEPGAGAQGYEVSKRPAFEGSQWQPLGLVPGNHFVDNQLPNNRLFYYRVRPINARGPAEFSNTDSGFAGMQQPRDIGGVVMNGQGQPIAGMPVTLAGYGPELTRFTGPDGYFKISGLPGGHYIVAPLGRNIDVEPKFLMADLTQQLHAELHFTGHPAQLGGAIWGFVMAFNLNPDGTGDGLVPVPGAAMKLIDADEPGHELNFQTDEAGFYAFVNLPHGPFKVSGAKDGLNFIPMEQGAGLDLQTTRVYCPFIALPPPPPPGDPNGGGGGTQPPPDGGDPAQP
jgi:hypothetical protein